MAFRVASFESESGIAGREGAAAEAAVVALEAVAAGTAATRC